MKTTLLIAAAALALCGVPCAIAQTSNVQKSTATNELTGNLATGGMTFTVSSVGTLEWADGAELAGSASLRAALGLGDLATLDAISSTEITDATIVNADISDSAAISISKVSGLQTALDGKQALDDDLADIALLTTTTFGRSLLTAWDASALRTSAGLGLSYLNSPFSTNGSNLLFSVAAALNGLSTTRGAIPYRGNLGWGAITPGTSGYALVSNGSGADPSYQAVVLPGGTLALGGFSSITGALAIANGGTGATTASGARVALLPSLAGNGGKVLAVKSDESDYELLSGVIFGAGAQTITKASDVDATPGLKILGYANAISHYDLDGTTLRMLLTGGLVKVSDGCSHLGAGFELSQTYGGLALARDYLVRWSSANNFYSTHDLTLGREAAGVLQLGVDGSAPTGQAVKAPDGTGTDVAGADITVASGRGTGSGAGGSVIIQTAPAGSSGTTAGTLTTRVTVKPSGIINIANMPTSSAGLSSGDLWNDSGAVKIVP